MQSTVIITGENSRVKTMEKSKTVGFIGGKFLPFHLGHVYVILAASNLVDELSTFYLVSEAYEKLNKILFN